jgi:hypothetical protein
MQMLAAIVVTVLPFLAIAALLLLSQRMQRRRAERTARQVAVTDAIHRELGAVVAPVLEMPVLSPSRLLIPVPFDRPVLVGRVLAVAQRALEPGARPEQIVLVPQASARTW